MVFGFAHIVVGENIQSFYIAESSNEAAELVQIFLIVGQAWDDDMADPDRDEWLQNLLAGWEGEDPQTLAGLILSESIRRENLQDDCGIQVLYLAKEGTVKKV